MTFRRARPRTVCSVDFAFHLKKIGIRSNQGISFDWSNNNELFKLKTGLFSLFVFARDYMQCIWGIRSWQKELEILQLPRDHGIFHQSFFNICEIKLWKYVSNLKTLSEEIHKFMRMFQLDLRKIVWYPSFV